MEDANYAVEAKSNTNLAASLEDAADQVPLIKDSRFAVPTKSSAKEAADIIAAVQKTIMQDAKCAVEANSYTEVAAGIQVAAQDVPMIEDAKFAVQA